LLLAALPCLPRTVRGALNGGRSSLGNNRAGRVSGRNHTNQIVRDSRLESRRTCLEAVTSQLTIWPGTGAMSTASEHAIGLPDRFQEAAFANLGVTSYEGHALGSRGRADESIGRIAQKSGRESSGQCGDRRVNRDNRHTGRIKNQLNRSVHRAAGTEKTSRKQHGEFPEGDRGDREAVFLASG